MQQRRRESWSPFRDRCSVVSRSPSAFDREEDSDQDQIWNASILKRVVERTPGMSRRKIEGMIEEGMVSSDSVNTPSRVLSPKRFWTLSRKRSAASNICSNIELDYYYCFDVKEKRNDVGEKLFIPLKMSSGTDFTMEQLREILYNQFGVKKDSRIFYIDGDDDKLPIDSECEFLEALKCTQIFTLKKGMPLLVESMGHTEQCSEQCTSGVSNTERRVESSKQQNAPAESAEKVSPIHSTDSNSATMDVACEMKPKDVAPKEPNVSTQQWHSDASPPSWFTEYMESMKKDMVSIVTNEVVKQMTEVLNKRLDFLLEPLANSEVGQSRRYPSLSKRYPRCPPSDSHANESNQKRLNVQDEEQSSDISIESVDEPQDTNIARDLKQQLRQEKLNLKHDLYRIKNQIRMLLKEEHHRISEVIDNLDTDAGNGQEQSVVQGNNARKDSALPTCCESLLVDQYDQRIQTEPLKIPDGELRMNCSITGNQMLDGDRPDDTWYDNFTEDVDKISLCSGSFVAADDQEQEDAFVIIQMPNSKNIDQSLAHPTTSATAVAEQRQQRDNSRDSPSFELLSETPSPPSSLYIDEEHFSSAFSVNGESPQPPEEPNQSTGSPYVMNIFDDVSPSQEFTDKVQAAVDADEHMNISLEKRSDGTYSFTAETLPTYETNSAKSSEHQTSDEQKTSQENNARSSNGDTSSSSTNYMNAESDQPETPLFYSRAHSQSQTDSNDFTQSFHSHTTSVTDNGDVFAESCASFAEQTLRPDETATRSHQRATAAATKASSLRQKMRDCRHSRHGRKLRGMMEERFFDDVNRHFRHDLNRGSGFDGSSAGSRTSNSEQVPSAADPVHILPETLVTVAAHVGSIAYVTARDMLSKFDKLRSQTVSSQAAFKF